MTTNQPLKHCVQMNLPDHLVIEASRLATLENSDNLFNGHSSSGEIGLEMAMDVGKKWGNGRTLRVRFLDGNQIIQEKVKRYGTIWSRYANIKFVFGNDPDAEIRISFQHPEGGYWSYVGTDNLAVPKNEATMNFGGFLKNKEQEIEIYSVVLHEFGHCIGLSHEQSNPVANIPWDRDAVYRYYAEPKNGGWTKEKVDQNVLDKLDSSSAEFTPSDPKSIMQYAVPNELTIGDFEIGWNTELSETDKLFIGQMYPL